MLVRFLCFAISAIKIKIDIIPTVSTYNEQPLPSHPTNDSAKYNPPAVDSTQPKLIWCMCFTDPSETTIKYPSLSCCFSTSSIVVAIWLYLLWSGANVTNSMRLSIHADWSTNSCSNDSGRPSGNVLSSLSSAPSSLYLCGPMKILQQILTRIYVLQWWRGIKLTVKKQWSPKLQIITSRWDIIQPF